MVVEAAAVAVTIPPPTPDGDGVAGAGREAAVPAAMREAVPVVVVDGEILSSRAGEAHVVVVVVVGPDHADRGRPVKTAQRSPA